jgi:hypothetical protein
VAGTEQVLVTLRTSEGKSLLFILLSQLPGQERLYLSIACDVEGRDAALVYGG